ncbi:hypothetical protein B0H17DRAFT_1185575 [Mycena rosella]|uniref:Uncharacterized protein n=1 Tax=Mycena rosella TaxID=1033263 RepID=A0AAD7CR87_MYCRO|nr:hypothetical protein B0H17DRAFT_1185575 [Mycena rosella]
MMFPTLALFALATAAAASSIARAPAAPAVAHASAASLSPLVITVLETCVNTNLGNCLVWSATTLPVGCTSLAASGQASSVSSVSSSAGIECTLFTSTTCTGASQLINGTVNALSVVAYDNLANSFTCQSN